MEYSAVQEVFGVCQSPWSFCFSGAEGGGEPVGSVVRKRVVPSVAFSDLAKKHREGKGRVYFKMPKT